MRKIAIVYASKHGQTSKVARYMEGKLQERGYSTQRINCVKRDETLSSSADAAILGSPVYAGKFSKALLRWARDHSPWLRGIPVGLFTVSLNAADQRPKARADDDRLLRELAGQLGVYPTHVASVAGALKYRSYWWPVRLMMKRIAAKAGGSTDTSRDHEYTSWSRVDSFLEAFTESRARSAFAAAAHLDALPADPAGLAAPPHPRPHEGARQGA